MSTTQHDVCACVWDNNSSFVSLNNWWFFHLQQTAVGFLMPKLSQLSICWFGVSLRDTRNRELTIPLQQKDHNHLSWSGSSREERPWGDSGMSKWKVMLWKKYASLLPCLSVSLEELEGWSGLTFGSFDGHWCSAYGSTANMHICLWTDNVLLLSTIHYSFTFL